MHSAPIFFANHSGTTLLSIFLRISPVRADSVPTSSAVPAGSIRAGSRFVSVCAGSVCAGSVLVVPVRFVATLNP